MADFFADIAAGGIGGRQHLLEEQKPQKIKKKAVRLVKKDFEPIKTKKKIDTREELYAELGRMRAKYKPYLENYAPKYEQTNVQIPITEFTLDGNEKVTIPHYGGPRGYCKKVYESTFTIDEINKDKAYYICFKGADYKAVVYVNGTCVGTHEGFFSPFEFVIDENIKVGENHLKIDLYNDYVYQGSNGPVGGRFEGEKLYAATGLGWDDPEVGWHHCPPGMGIYNKVFVDIRNRINITDIFVRQDEIWVEVTSEDYDLREIELAFSIYGQNFEETVVENYRYIPQTMKTVGMGDSLTEAQIKDQLGKGTPMPMKKGVNIYKIPYKIENPKMWDLNTPYLYQVQAEVYFDGKMYDKKHKQFGVRSFVQDLESNPKGMFYLNGRKIRLRGANTMGFEQQDVLREDFDQLIDDILLAKLCNMNFLRLTQRPCQDEVYEYCDKLGLMTQTDLPLFGCMRRTKFAEGVRQAEEMERIIRCHPCNVIISYINEPFPNAYNSPHRHFLRHELADFFDSCDTVVHLQNPDRVIKHVDGDYDPPCKSMPDNHCYPMWYNAHGIDIGRLHKGYWLPVKPGWYYGCGEYGTEGLECSEVMKEYYPKEWLTEPFNPGNIVNAQTASFYSMFYDKQESMEDWIEASQTFQAYGVKVMTEAFRRDDKMISNAIHLFIDAWPSGWMKTIMDCKRNPKKAYFAYRNALEPVMLSLRTDRYTYFEGEKISIECYICNDTHTSGNYKVTYELADMTGSHKCFMKECGTTYVSNAEFKIKEVNDRQKFVLKAILTDENGKVVSHTEQQIEVFKKVPVVKNDKVELITNLKPGTYEIAGETVKVKPCGMLPVHFASRKTGHPAVEGFEEKDFSYWYDKSVDMITPIIYNTFEAEGFTPILLSGNTNDDGKWGQTLACAEKEYNGKKYIICNVDLRQENPVAQRFINSVMK